MVKKGKTKGIDLKTGVAGVPDAFSREHKNKDDVFAWLASLGLDAMEYQAVYGVRTSEKKARRYGELAAENGIIMSVHAPYYVSLATADLDVRARSVGRLLKALKLAEWLGSTRVIFHPGYFQGPREEGLGIIIDNLRKVEKETDTTGVHLYPETGGKVKALGATEDIIEICRNVGICRPCIDWAHEHARSGGSLNKKEDFIELLEKLDKGLKKDVLADLHIHYSQIKWTEAGEQSHAQFDEKDENGRTYKPDYKLMLKALAESEMDAVVVSECRDSQEAGALAMQKYYERYVK